MEAKAAHACASTPARQARDRAGRLVGDRLRGRRAGGGGGRGRRDRIEERGARGARRERTGRPRGRPHARPFRRTCDRSILRRDRRIRSSGVHRGRHAATDRLAHGRSRKRARQAFDVRYWATLAAARYAAPHPHEGGSMVLTSGISAHRPAKGWVLGASGMRGRVDALTRALAIEFAPLRVNSGVAGSCRDQSMADHERAGPARHV